MGISAGAALLISAAVTAAGTAYTANEQNKARKEVSDENDRVQEEAAATEARIFGEQAKAAKDSQAETVIFGSGDGGNSAPGSYDDFLSPIVPTEKAKKTGLNSQSSTSPLGF